jgi:SAM-dependent methyltransferase
MAEDILTARVQEKYAAVARGGTAGREAGVRAVAEAFGYSAAELAALPAQANLGLSCGNPVALANLRPGEVVVDLGCGGGLDVLLAAQKVGPSGKAIGIDMTPEMLELARKNATAFGGGAAPANVAFHLGRIEHLPLPDASVDCLVSNCVINLAPDKPAVFREMFRVLRPVGRIAVSDIALKRPLPPQLAQDILAYVGCIAGAILIADYEQALVAAGFGAVHIVETGSDLNAYALAGDADCRGAADRGTPKPLPTVACCGGAGRPLQAQLADLLTRYDVNAYAASVSVYAVKS